MAPRNQAPGRDRRAEQDAQNRRRRLDREQLAAWARGEAILASLPATSADPHFPKTWLEVMSEEA